MEHEQTQIIEENMGLVVSIVDSLKPRNSTEREDWIDVGRIALWNAIQTFDDKYNNSIATYAWRPIRWSIIKEIKKRKYIARLTHQNCPAIKHKTDFWEYLPSDLTKDEVKLIELYVQGYRYKEISHIIGVSTRTIYTRFLKIFNKIRSQNNG